MGGSFSVIFLFSFWFGMLALPISYYYWKSLYSAQVFHYKIIRKAMVHAIKVKIDEIEQMEDSAEMRAKLLELAEDLKAESLRNDASPFRRYFSKGDFPYHWFENNNYNLEAKLINYPLYGDDDSRADWEFDKETNILFEKSVMNGKLLEQERTTAYLDQAREHFYHLMGYPREFSYFLSPSFDTLKLLKKGVEEVYIENDGYENKVVKFDWSFIMSLLNDSSWKYLLFFYIFLLTLLFFKLIIYICIKKQNKYFKWIF